MHFLEIREDCVCDILERRVEDRFCEFLFCYKAECVVDRVEDHDEQADDEGTLKEREYRSKQFVQPSEHHYLE